MNLQFAYAYHPSFNSCDHIEHQSRPQIGFTVGCILFVIYFWRRSQINTYKFYWSISLIYGLSLPPKITNPLQAWATPKCSPLHHSISFQAVDPTFSKNDRQSELLITHSFVQPLAVMYMVPAGQPWAQETENLASFGHLFPSCLLLLET